jgi:hypothetical protein
MRIDMRKCVFLACLLILALICARSLQRAPILPEPTALEEEVPTDPATVAGVDIKTLSRLPLLAPEPAPAAVIGELFEMPEDPDELRGWARQFPEEALAWLRTAAAGVARDTVAEMICAHVAESDPAEAVSLAERYAGGCSNLLENLVHQWADRDEPAARAYAMNQPPGAERDRLLSRVAFTRAKENPADAARLVAEWISPGAVQDEAAISVLHQWALRDADAALAWAQLFPDETLRDRALSEVVNTVSPQQE